MAKARTKAEVGEVVYRCAACGEPAAYEATHRDVERAKVRIDGIDKVVEHYRKTYLCLVHARAAAMSSTHPRSLHPLPHYADAASKAQAAARRAERKTYREAQPRLGEDWGKR